MRKVIVWIFGSLVLNVAGISQNRIVSSNQWAATDNLGRKLSASAETGPLKNDKTVGLFYWTWHTDDIAAWTLPDGSVANLTQILSQHPEAANDLTHPAWQGVGEGGIYFWDEPLFGYYRTTDEWVLRKHAEMLADAGVDVIFLDNTNGNFTWKSSYTVLMKVWNQARLDGVKTPRIAFLLPFGITDGTLTQIYELYSEIYKPGLYQDLWFMYDGKPLIMAYPDAITTRTGETAGLKFTATEPFYAVNATCPSWGNNQGSLTFKLYAWNSTYGNSVNGTPLSEKTFVDFNDNEKITLTFDQLPAGDYVWELSNGTETVGVWKWTDGNNSTSSYFSGNPVSGNYVSEIAYNPGNFTSLTNGTTQTPVRINLPTINQQLATEMRNFFTFRPGQPLYTGGPSANNQWGWLEAYPQNGYGLQTDGSYEETTVGVAQNTSDARNGQASAFNSELTYGRSYTHAAGQNTLKNAYLHGFNFQEQWNRAFEIDPELIFVTGWNEWTAGMWFNWDVQPFSFVDQYSAEKSRDIEPVKSWGNNGDVYYMQLVDNIRKFKGMQDPDPVSPPTTIDVADPDIWADIKPAYYSYRGNTLHRNAAGQGNSLTYTNTTGRNDIVLAKVARDNEYIYFYVETDNILTDKTDDQWMRLFIDTDRDKSTGWEGYDYVINRNSPSDSILVERSVSGWDWTSAGRGSYAINDKSLIIKIKRSVLGFDTGNQLNFEFKWSDNMQEDGNIMDFYVNGDAAPGGRFNYVYTVNTSPEGYYFPANPEDINQGVKCEQYNGVFDEIPVFNTLSLKETHYLPQLEIPAEVSGDCALRYSGFINVPAKDIYTFSIESDEDATLYIDNIKVVGYVKGQEEQSGSIKLMPGIHALKSEYIAKAENNKFLKVYIETPDTARKLIPESMLYKQNALPEILLKYKGNQNYFCELDTFITASATDPDGSIRKIEIFDNDKLIREESGNTFELANFAAGRHTLYAEATDNDGAKTTSNGITVEVKPSFPVPGIIPAEEYRTAANTTIINSNDSDGGVSIRSDYGYVDYPIEVKESGIYQITFRVPFSRKTKDVTIKTNGQEIATVNLGNTPSEAWCDINAVIELSEGVQLLGLDCSNSVATIHRMELSKATAIANHSADKLISVYPNPSRNEFIIQSREKIESIDIHDLSGRMTGSFPVVKNKNTFSAGSELMPGLYVLTVTLEDGTKHHQKVIKK